MKTVLAERRYTVTLWNVNECGTVHETVLLGVIAGRLAAMRKQINEGESLYFGIQSEEE